MNKTRNDWWCSTCKFRVFGTKPKCLKCGASRNDIVEVKRKVEQDYWTPGNDDPKWNRLGPYSYLKGGYSGEPLEGEPQDLKYPNCGCNKLENCPQRHHEKGCNCYTCRGKPHKW